MKIRAGFVSNSSSSSFMCEICALEVETFEEEPIYSQGMIQCENYHIFCFKHINSKFKIINNIPKTFFYRGRRTEPLKKEYCPICNLETTSEFNMMRYVYLLEKKNKKEIVEEIKNKFKTHKELMDFLNTKKE